jgi:hypothetical protein
VASTDSVEEIVAVTDLASETPVEAPEPPFAQGEKKKCKNN